jgi:rhamnogalacturonyl hydrolase YesR
MMQPYLSGATPTLDGEINGVKLAGHMAFAELALAGDEAAVRLARAAADRFRPDDDAAPARYGQYWCEDLFMTGTLLSRAGRLPDGVPFLELAARTHAAYLPVLQQPGGLFHHARDGRFCWGRGNGFAALGLSELLEALSRSHPRRAELLEAFSRQMAALRAVQAADGTWRQVADLAGSYREVTATAMTLAAMARGVRNGWLDASYRETVQRAWSGLSPRIGDDGTLVDVCEGTGTGPTLRYYLDRKAIHGTDDRGGAMCLLAAIELMQLTR